MHTCLEGKHIIKFPKEGMRKACQILRLVHFDICGSLQTSTHSSCKYFITFIDDMTRYIFVYFMKYKLEASNKFIHYKKFVEKKTNHKIKKFKIGSSRGIQIR